MRKTAVTPQPKLARGTRDISPATIATIKVARGTRDMEPLGAIDADDDTIVVDTDPNLTDELVMEADGAEVAEAADTGDSEVSDVGETSEVTESQATAIDARMLDLGKRRFGISAFRPGQALAIRNVLAGIDTLAIMPTGAGKSLCYQLPALELDGVTLVVSPLIALMKDQHDKLAELDIEVLRLDSTLSPRDEAAALSRLSENRPCIAYVTPERLGEPRFRERLAAVRVALFVVDEAHCISQWGHDFRPDYFFLAEAARRVGARATIGLTATATPAVADDIARRLMLRDPVRVTTGFDRPNLS
ncbi:MAG TPA: DEAD/DEAH box helicase, partial [Kofleriaceae bacterium]